MTDECHSTGFIGQTGRGTHEYHNVMGKVDIITGTLGKALGGAMGGFTSGRHEIIDILRQRSRPYLFSNSLAPAIVGASNAVFDLLEETTELRDKVMENALYFRSKMSEAGFDVKEGIHPITPIMLYDAPLSQKFAEELLKEGIYVIGFFLAAIIDTTIVWTFAGIAIALMTLPNLLGILLLRKDMKESIADYKDHVESVFQKKI